MTTMIDACLVPSSASSAGSTRREVLQRTGVLAAGALATGLLPHRALSQPVMDVSNITLSSNSRTRTLRFAHLTDMHVQPERKAGEGLTACLHSVQELKDKPELIITGGDLIMDSLETDEARTKAQWDVFTRVLKGECGLPVQHTIGNHDIWGWTRSKSKCTGDEPHYGKRWVMEALGLTKPYSSFERGGWKIIILDSVRPLDEGYIGGLDEEQMDWLASELQSSGGKPVMIVSHIPIFGGCVLFMDGQINNNQWRVGGGSLHLDARKIMRLFLQHPNVKLCISGHFHLLERSMIQGVTYICDGAVCGSWWKKQPCPEHDKPYRVAPGYGVFDLYDNGTFEHQYLEYGWQLVEA